MTAARFTAGEVVDVTIKGARVAVPDADDYADALQLTYATPNTPDCPLRIRTSAPGVTVTRVAPAEWPPTAGDVWADRDGEEWAAVARDGDPDRVELMYLADDSGGYQLAGSVATDLGPMRLQYRRGWSEITHPETETDDAGEVDERAAGIAGLLALVDFLKSNPDVPFPNGATVQHSVLHWNREGRLDEAGRIAEAERIARLLGVELDDSLNAECEFGGGVHYRIHTYRDAKPVTPSLTDDDLRDAKPAVTAEHDGYAVGRAAAK